MSNDHPATDRDHFVRRLELFVPEGPIDETRMGIVLIVTRLAEGGSDDVEVCTTMRGRNPFIATALAAGMAALDPMTTRVVLALLTGTLQTEELVSAYRVRQGELVIRSMDDTPTGEAP